MLSGPLLTDCRPLALLGRRAIAAPAFITNMELRIISCRSSIIGLIIHRDMICFYQFNSLIGLIYFFDLSLTTTIYLKVAG